MLDFQRFMLGGVLCVGHGCVEVGHGWIRGWLGELRFFRFESIRNEIKFKFTL